MLSTLIASQTIAHQTIAHQIIAHQGGWDEILAVGAPMVLFGALLIVARRRARVHTARPQDNKTD